MTEPTAMAPPPVVAGRTLPGGKYRITAEENRDFCAAVGGAVADDGAAHPMFFYIATQCAMGLSVAELLSWCDFDVVDGPLMTGSHAQLHDALKIDQSYRVTGEIVSLVRKPSRTFGTVDLLTFCLTLSDGDHAVAVNTSSWMLRRSSKP